MGSKLLSTTYGWVNIKKHLWVPLWIITVIGSSLLTACSPIDRQQTQQVPTSSSSSPQHTPEFSPVPTEPPKRTSTVTPMEKSELNDIQLTLSQTDVDHGQPISVTVTNLSSSTIGTYDHKSMCSIFTIQRKRGEKWENILKCTLGKPTVPVVLSPGESKSLTFNGGPHHLDPGALDPGIYRVEFTYKPISAIEDLSSNEIPWLTIYTPLLTIK